MVRVCSGILRPSDGVPAIGLDSSRRWRRLPFVLHTYGWTARQARHLTISVDPGALPPPEKLPAPAAAPNTSGIHSVRTDTTSSPASA
ncbi:hypothetical protein BV898_19111 [Hypsibius exemplaris]|uniref:Uncharacterized protein n=1 Tax=Hypsibius exemplaris TaxID=2072580 RepID=A0A9X6RP44_HYPEX|nr:hypothetical protein BV898_19111 [Hypsibius exemplaris]